MSTSVKSSLLPKKRPYKNWKNDILPKIIEQQHIHRNQGIPATIRGLLYIFEGIILEKKDYGSLSKHLVAWREKGDIEGDWIVDKSRRIIDITQYENEGKRILKVFDESIQTFDTLIKPFEHIRCGIDYLRKSKVDFYNHIPKWLGQPNYVEVWVEKSAMGSVLNSILDKENMMAIVAPNGGWSSYTFAADNLDRLLRMKYGQNKNVYVQYYGDSDPSGERMTAKDSKMVRLLESHGINFERIAITDKTIKDFKMERLKEIRDADTFEKLTKNDPNRKWFMERHNGQVWQIEVDALQLDMDKFKHLVVNSVNKHFDPKVHERVVRQIKETYTPESIHNDLIKQLKELTEDLRL